MWVSHSYGYDGDLMYFAEIFRAFRAYFPNTVIPVDAATPWHDADDLPLLPLRAFRTLRWKRKVRGVDYDASLALPRFGYARSLRNLRTECLITIEFTAPALLAMALAWLKPRTGRVLLVESDPGLRGGSNNPLVLAVKRLAARAAHVVQTNTPEGKAYLTQVLRVDPAKIRVAPYLTSCPPRPDALPPPRTDKVRLLFVNSLQPRKGVDHLIAALGLLTPEVATRLDVTIVGDGPSRQRAEAMAKALEGHIAIRFEGRKAYRQLGTYYADADILAIPSIVDYRSLAGFEGLAYGLALIQSRFDGASHETVIEGETGFAIDPANHAEIAGRLTALVEDPALLARCKADAARLYAERYSVRQIAENLAESASIAMAKATGST